MAPQLNVSIASIARDGLLATALFVYVMGVLLLTKKLYHAMRNRGVPHNVAIYYNRKVIHMAAGGLVAALVPFLFKEFVVPTIMAFVLALMTYIPHRTGKLLYWFQTEENMYEVNFCIAWGVSLAILWVVLGNPKLAVLPAMLISFGDGITGVVRNKLFGRRTKHWIGNVAMASLSLPLGYVYAGPVGMLAGGLACIAERFEFNPIDDNMLIGLVSTVTLVIAHLAGMI